MKKPILRKCPPGESFVRSVSGDLEEREKGRLAEHAERCPKCQLRLKTLASVQAQLEARKNDLPEVALSPEDESEFRKMAREQARGGLGKDRLISSRLVRTAGVLAAGLILIIAGHRIFVKESSPGAVMRGSSRVEIRLHQPEGKIEEAPKVFSWSKVEDSSGYRLDIIDAGLHSVFSTTIRGGGTRLLLPEDVRQRLERQEPYLWTVSAYGDDEQEFTSASAYFEIE